MTSVQFNIDNLAAAALAFEDNDSDQEPEPQDADNTVNNNNPIVGANPAAILPPAPTGPPQGPLAATNNKEHTMAEALEADLTYNVLLGPTSTLTTQDRLEQIADQPPPFALLII